MDSLRLLVVGAGKTACDICKVISHTNGLELVGIVGDDSKENGQSSIVDLAGKLESPVCRTRSLKCKDVKKFMLRLKPDYMISANNFLIFDKECLKIAKFGTINFHNGLLPRYAGVNPFCWAILKGERTYGITWHFMDLEIDSGPIVCQRSFDLAPDERALTLMIKCIKAGVETFRDNVVPLLLRNDLPRMTQNLKSREYFSANFLPNNGSLPWWESETYLERLSRAIDFAPLEPSFFRPKLVTKSHDVLYIGKFEIINKTKSSSEDVGKILEIEEETVFIAGQHVDILAGDLSKAIGVTSENQPVNLSRFLKSELLVMR